MIEIATSAAFLMASLYGAGHANAKTSDMVANPVSAETAGITRTLTDSKQIEKYIRERYSDTPILVEVARCESTFRQFDPSGQVIRGLVNKGDVGVMQINEKYHGDEASKEGYDIFSVEGNVAFAKHLYDKFGTSPWSSSSKCWSATVAMAEK